jgi:glycosyltransferase involved in cell wall biosynthesis
MDIKKIHLMLFLSRATSLERWNQLGILEREIKYYRELSNHLGGLSLVTSGGQEDLQYRSQLGKMELLYNKWGLPANIYSILSVFLHWPALKTADVFKTNQLDGSWTAVLAGMLHHKPVIVRAGYLWSQFFQLGEGKGIKSRIIQALQTITLKRSTAIFVTTETMGRELKQDFPFLANKIHIIPNYVDLELFKPDKSRLSKRGRICFVGRLNPQKNLTHLLLALSEIPDCSLIVVGDGGQRVELEKLAHERGVDVQFSGVVPHSNLPGIIKSCQIFILPSLYEGHPKALVEAMACGVPVIGTNVPGIKELILHGQTGMLCSPEIESIRETLKDLLANQEIQQQLGENACRYVTEYFSLPKVLEMEIEGIKAASDLYEQS